MSEPVLDLFYARTFAIAATLLLGFALFRIALPFIDATLWATFLAFLLYPVHLRLTALCGGRANLSAALLTLAAFVFLVGPVAGVGAALFTQLGELVSWVQDTLAQRTPQQYRSLAALPLVEPLLRWLQDNFGIDAAQVKVWIAQVAEQAPALIAALGRRIFLGAVETSIAFVVMLFMLFFLMRDGGRIVEVLSGLVPMSAARRGRLLRHIAEVTRAVVFGTGITVLVQGAVVGVAFWITGLDAPLVFGALAAVLALLPFGGTAFVWVPATLVLAGNDRWGMALAMVAIGTFSSLIDNLLRPLLISGRADIGTLAVFVGVLGGAAAFGPTGLILGPVVIALVIALLRFALELRQTDDLGAPDDGRTRYR